jgi:hypothetical protein
MKAVHPLRAALVILTIFFASCSKTDSVVPVTTSNTNAKILASPFLDIPVVADGLPATLDITSFSLLDGVLTAIGSLTTDLGTFPVEIPVTTITSTCEILHLELGPVDLDLLGLVVHLDQVVLDISADAGPGNLLGNLLCALTNLLNNPLTNLNRVAALLTKIVGIL